MTSLKSPDIIGFNRSGQPKERPPNSLLILDDADVGMTFLSIIVGFVIVAAFLMILGISGIMFFNVSRFFNRTVQQIENENRRAESANSETSHAEKRRRALEIVANQPEGTPAHKCRGCGATVDSTAELSADGKVRCNYCNQWTSIYQ